VRVETDQQEYLRDFKKNPGRAKFRRERRRGGDVGYTTFLRYTGASYHGDRSLGSIRTERKKFYVVM